MRLLNLLNRQRRPRITFIFGSPRGGTTWLWLLLEAAKDVIPFIEDLSTNSKIIFLSNETEKT